MLAVSSDSHSHQYDELLILIVLLILLNRVLRIDEHLIELCQLLATLNEIIYTSDRNISVKHLCEAKFPYKAQNEDELSFKEGDIILLINKDSQDPGWWQGELNGKIGVFPDNFVIPISNADDRSSNTENNKLSRIVTETGAIKPSSIASQRKSLEVKSEKKSSELKNDKVSSDPNPTSNKSPPIPGKKPAISLKKSPSGSGTGLFSEIKKKLVDVVDGTTSSKNQSPKTEPSEPTDNSSENAFDQVERRPLLTDVRATRVKAPGRRLPTNVHKDEDHSIPNGNVDHLSDTSEASLLTQASETDGEKPRLREWEKHKAPWLEEMKKNQAKRTSVPPGPENKPNKLTPMTDKSVDVEESTKPNKLSPLEKEVDMSKSMPALDLSKSLNAKLKTSPSELDKVPSMKSKPAIPTVAANRHSLMNNIKEMSPALNRHTISMPSMVVKDTAVVKPPAPAPPKVSPVSPAMSKSPVSSENAETVKQSPDVQESITNAQYVGLLERLQKLEITVEKQNRSIEELKNKLQLETDMRMLLQERVSQNVQV